MLKSDLKTVREILGASEKYIVPDYQRNFEWKKEHAEDFWNDIKDSSCFLGTLVLDQSSVKKRESKIVDGQQRLTTILIFLSACRVRAKELKKKEQALAIQDKLSFRDDTTGSSGTSKFTVSPSIRDIFEETIAKYEWDDDSFNLKNKKRQINKVRPIYELFKSKLEKFSTEEISQILENLYSSTFVSIEIQNTQEAFEIFERMNARGMELNAADLLKNYLFANSNSDELIHKWDDITINSQGNILRMIKYFYVSKFGLIQKKQLFGALKSYGEDVGAEILLNEIYEFVALYSLILNGSHKDIIEWASKNNIKELTKEYSARALNRSFDALSLFGVTQGYPVILKVMRLVSESEGSKKEEYAKDLMRLVDVIERYHFLNNAVSHQPGNEVEKYYSDKCKEVIKTKDINRFVKQIIGDLSKKKVSNREFLDRFKELNYENDFSLIYYIYDRLNNSGRRSSQYIEIYNSDKKILRKNYNIEHLISQNPSEYNLDDAEGFEDFKHNIGNLIVISFHTNSSINNMHIDKKLKVFEEKETQNLPEVRILLKDWSDKNWKTLKNIEKNILDRAEKLGSRAFNEVWKL